MQTKLDQIGSRKKKISLHTAQRWLYMKGWCYGRKKSGMYIDGHECEDVVEYQRKFIEQWKVYEKQMYTYNNNGKLNNELSGFPVPPGQ